MANSIIDVQISFPSSVKTPFVAGDKRLTLLNLARLLRGLNAGTASRTGQSYAQFQATLVAASATVTMAAPTTGQTVSIAGTALTAQQSRARATCTPTTAIAGDTVTVNGVLFTGTAGAVVLGAATFSIDASDAATATSLAAQVNAYVSSSLNGLLNAQVLASGVVTFVALAEGTSGNALTLTSSSNTTLPVTGSGVLAGGAAVANNKFDFGSGNALVANSFARAVNASTTAAVQQASATSDGVSVVTVTAKVAGVAGNAVTFTSSDGGTLAVTGSGFLASGSAGAATRFAF
jgi:hypothetical protein